MDDINYVILDIIRAMIVMDKITKTSDGLRDAFPLGSMPERTHWEISDQDGKSYPST